MAEDKKRGELCACGKPLHYTDERVEATTRKIIARLGPEAHVSTSATMGHSDAKTYAVQRHYLVLHGLAAMNLKRLAAQGVIRDITHEVGPRRRVQSFWGQAGQTGQTGQTARRKESL